jgi:hypothetical protein
MATNATNSNAINIANLPQTQVAADTDLIVLETQNGTQTIQFQNFNVVRADTAGNATVVGNITGSNAVFTNIRTASLTPDAVYAGNELGITKDYAYQNSFKTTNGIIVSSDYITGSPEYIQLLNLYNTLSANSSQAYKKVYEYTGIAEIPANASSSSIINVGRFPLTSGGTSVGSLIGNSVNYASYFMLTPYSPSGYATSCTYAPTIGDFSYFPGTGVGDDYMLFLVRLPAINSASLNTRIGVRILYFYN